MITSRKRSLPRTSPCPARVSAPDEVGETQILAALLGIAEMLGGLTDTRELLEAVVRIAPGLVRVDRCAILAYDATTHEFRASVAFAPPGGGKPFEGLRIPESDMPRLAQRLVALHLPALVKRDSRDPGLPPAVAQRLGLRSALLVPLVARGQILGVLWLDDSAHSHYFTSKEINVAQGVATTIAVALDGAARLEALAMERRRFEALAHSVSDGVIVLDRDLRVQEMDRSAEDLLGWQTGEVRGRRAYELFAISEAEAGVSWTRAADAPAPASKLLRLRTRTGSVLECEVLAIPVRGEDAQATQILYVLRRPTSGRGPRAATAPARA